ncbi:PREDICTED: plexin-B2-like, partial [Nanorana parkeri]|uniref:plexin-B2-like n=1 Tax=Nanorana parkeri TaxID=125878 RepID=UPI0008540877
MAQWIHIMCIFILAVYSSKAEQFSTFMSETEVNHLMVYENTGSVYVGAVNHVYQLNGNLELLVNISTGPKKDDKKCTPPIDQNQCPNAVLSDNYNKLLLLDVAKERIVVCGSLFKGICSLRQLNNFSKEISYDDSRGEKSFVASNDEKVETVGLIADMTKDGPRVLFVGKGTSQHDNGIIISTRILDEMDDKGPFETYTDSANLKYGSASANTQQFITVFEDPRRVYFISSRLDKTLHKNRTLITRLCKSDYNYFSYVEMDLGCKDQNNIPYNICTSAFLASPGQELADAMKLSNVQDKVLFGVFSTFINNREQSAVCMFSLSDINQKFEQNREECYTSSSESVNQDGESIFSKPFGDKIGCGGKQSSNINESVKYPCGSEHLPYPLQSRNGVTAKAVLVRETNPFTSIAVSVENEHTIAFLGTAEGKLVKAHVGNNAREYRTVPFSITSSVKNGMVFDAAKEHLYVMTRKKVHRVPVQQCDRYSDCNDCIQAKDPYCGWCVIEGRCSRKESCARANDPNHWLWSPAGVCMKIESVSQSNMSIKELGDVRLTVKPPIKLYDEDQLICDFGGNVQAAILQEDGSISCPQPEKIPDNERGKDFVDVPITLTIRKEKRNVFFANYSYQFYNCAESAYISENVPCISCVNTKWKCQWDTVKHKCVDFQSEPVTI